MLQFFSASIATPILEQNPIRLRTISNPSLPLMIGFGNPPPARHRVRPVARPPNDTQCHLFSNSTLPKPTMYIDNLYNKLARTFHSSCRSRSPNLLTDGFVFPPSNPMTEGRSEANRLPDLPSASPTPETLPPTALAPPPSVPAPRPAPLRATLFFCVWMLHGSTKVVVRAVALLSAKTKWRVANPMEICFLESNKINQTKNAKNTNHDAVSRRVQGRVGAACSSDG